MATVGCSSGRHDTEAPDSDVIVIDAGAPGDPIDSRVFGTNVPAWLGPDRLGDPAFRQLAVESGATVVRMPGGSWSNGYDWAGCEQGDPERCYWTWAARPTDFVDFLQATAIPGMWTVSINATAQSAAAAVAFFNGSVDDQRSIGVDRDGVDWGTVGKWAQLRADGGNAEPHPIGLWEIGNEVYGGKPDFGGEQCAQFGWEEVWTCDGAAYVAGDAEHDGYLDIRAAMREIDPTIEVGAVGVSDPSSWSDWGREVIDGAGESLDFYSVHQYAFDGPPDLDEVLSRASTLWPGVVDRTRSALPADVPIAVTEYNLVAFESGDTERVMTRAVNALFLAESLGQMIVAGVDIANQWNFANGTTGSGTDYGMIAADGYDPFPQYVAFTAWHGAGDSLLSFQGAPAEESVRLYPTRHADGVVTIVALNLGENDADIDLDVTGLGERLSVSISGARAGALDADRLSDVPGSSIAATAGEAFSVSLPALSISLVEVRADG